MYAIVADYIRPAAPPFASRKRRNQHCLYDCAIVRVTDTICALHMCIFSCRWQAEEHDKSGDSNLTIGQRMGYVSHTFTPTSSTG